VTTLELGGGRGPLLTVLARGDRRALAVARNDVNLLAGLAGQRAA